MIFCLGTTPAMSRSMTFATLKLDDVNRASAVDDYAAGKNVNAARVLTTLGEPATAIGFLGGPRAPEMRADMNAAGIAHNFLDVASPTRLCVTVIDRAAGTATELIEEPAAVTKDDVSRLLKQLADLVARAARPWSESKREDTGEPPNTAVPAFSGSQVKTMPASQPLLLLSGSLAPGVPVTFYRDCVALATSAGVRTIVDAAGEPLAKALTAKPFLVKPNRSELARTLGRSIDDDAQLRAAITDLLSMGPTWAVVTLGREGAIVSDGRECWRVNVPAIKPVSAIGSGDSFAAGLAAGIARGLTVLEAVRLAAACGVANARTERAGHLSRESVEQFLPQIELFPMT